MRLMRTSDVLRNDDSTSERLQTTYPAPLDSSATIASFRKAIQNLLQQAKDWATRLGRLENFEALAAKPPIGGNFCRLGETQK